MPPRFALVVVFIALLAAALLPSTPGHPLHGQTPQQEPSPQPTTVISPIAGNWTLLVNLDESGPPATLLSTLRPWATTAFTFDARTDRFRTFRFGRPQLSDLATLEAGQAFWLFVPPERLEGDLTFWEQPALIRNQPATLRPGFNLVAWTGTQGVRIAAAVGTLPIRGAWLWDPLRQRFDVWDPALPLSLQTNFALEYGVGLWIDLAGVSVLTWEQP